MASLWLKKMARESQSFADGAFVKRCLLKGGEQTRASLMTTCSTDRLRTTPKTRR